MPEQPGKSPRSHPLLRGVIEVSFIVFLFYSNLLMGQFDANGQRGKTLSTALYNIFTAKNFTIAISSALVGYVVFEYLRKRS